LLVSSKHLSLASSVFRRLLKSSLWEGEVFRANGTVTLSLLDDNVTAFSLIMKIVHVQNSQIPAIISESLLTSVAILVDKYDFHESVTS
jgi:hypothetical protein